jgi:hypothetical protein
MLPLLLLGPVADRLEQIANSVKLLVAVALLCGGVYSLLHHCSSKLEETYGAKSPESSFFGYASTTKSEQEQLANILNTWGIEGCNVYLNSAVIRFFYIPSYVTLLSAILCRSVSKAGVIFAAWDDHKDTILRSVIPQLALAMLVADYGETAILSLACLQFPKPIDLTLVVIADLCNKVKVVTLVIAGATVVVLMMLKSYLMPFLVLAKQPKQRQPKTAAITEKSKNANKTQTKTKYGNPTGTNSGVQAKKKE